MRRLLIVLPVVALFVVVGIGLFTTRPEAELGRPAPSFSLPTLADPERELGPADLRGQPAVVNFWASWCEPCRDEAPEFARVAGEHGGRVRFLGVQILDGRDEGLAYVEEFGIPYPSVRDASGRIADLYGVTGVPETVFLDAEGAIVGTYIGGFAEGQLADLVARLLSLRADEVLDITGRGETRPVP